MLTRRHFAGLAAAGAAASFAGFPNVARGAVPFKQPPLPFAENALEGTISAKTVSLHFGKHHASYYAMLNQLAPNTRYAEMDLDKIIVEAAKDKDAQRIFNNAGQARNHELYWEQFKPGGARQPSGALAQRIQSEAGGLEKLREEFARIAGTVFGSGWVWLAQDNGKLTIIGTSGGDNPLTKGMIPLLGVDVWEHAYYLDYQNDRSGHVKALFNNSLINWDVVASRLGA